MDKEFAWVGWCIKVKKIKKTEYAEYIQHKIKLYQYINLRMSKKAFFDILHVGQQCIERIHRFYFKCSLKSIMRVVLCLCAVCVHTDVHSQNCESFMSPVADGKKLFL